MNAYCVLYLEKESSNFNEVVEKLNTDNSMGIVIGIEDVDSVNFAELLTVFDKAVREELGDDI